ncbi:PadR family transcriptional regulator [Mucilaginibacter robiniae]|uniref:PadR family transcriptional regulator n=1 Tax=Mucilaginibacter robiniae TaxID=2728022 RepID=A0A7L5E6M7_9SPHI|nr:PadR family transcriptional regulator [Mucilaginibacter robiniae]QJD96036.1 PadR family transcriptional regulator [Mucilaginibacter robiniae]
MYSKELLKGTIEIIILKLLSENERMYGYEITQKVKELTDDKILISEGALYSSLHKLEATGVLDTESVLMGKRPRVYYRLTKNGKLVAAEKIAELSSFIKSLSNVIDFSISLA